MSGEYGVRSTEWEWRGGRNEVCCELDERSLVSTDAAGGLEGRGVGARGVASPLWAVMGFTWLSSLGTGLVANGVYFLTAHGYGFGKAENYALAAAGGTAYIGGALGAGSALRWLRARGVSTRGASVGIMVVLAVLCVVPMVAGRGVGGEAHALGERGLSGLGAHGSVEQVAAPAHWPMWVLICLYQPLTGMLWPVVERYLSGGRSGPGLRSALGRWNVTWCSALVVGLAAIGGASKLWGPDRFAQPMLAWLGVLHLASIVLLWPMGREPGEHVEGAHEPHPPVFERLLETFRLLLPTSYIVLNALTPVLPDITGRLGLAPEWQSPVASMWTVGRVAAFFLLERWHGWHGKWWPSVAAVVMLLTGFAGAVLSPRVGGGAGVAVLVVGLAAFGLGMATIYTASLYYAMECEREEVDAGSKHEALIGVGYVGGPACGLIGIAAVAMGMAGSEDGVMLGVVSVVAVGLAGVAGWRGRRNAQSTALQRHSAT